MTPETYFIPTDQLIEDNSRLRRGIAYALNTLAQIDKANSPPAWELIAMVRGQLNEVLKLPRHHDN